MNVTRANLQAMGVKDRIIIIILAKKFISKHDLTENVQNKENLLLKKVQNF